MRGLAPLAPLAPASVSSCSLRPCARLRAPSRIPGVFAVVLEPIRFVLALPVGGFDDFGFDGHAIILLPATTRKIMPLSKWVIAVDQFGCAHILDCVVPKR